MASREIVPPLKSCSHYPVQRSRSKGGSVVSSLSSYVRSSGTRPTLRLQMEIG